MPRVTLQAHNIEELRGLATRLHTEQRPSEKAVGLISYHAGAALLDLPSPHKQLLAEVHIYPAEQVFDGLPGSGQRTGIDHASLNTMGFGLREDFVSEMPWQDYQAALQQVHAYLLAGDCYQVNYSRRFSACFVGDSLAAWSALAARHDAPHGGFFRLTDGDSVFGVSPERFLQIRHGVVVTEPIKGSRPRGNTEAEDLQLGESLRHSSKDLAENLMIVDLLRNDLGKICEPGSVQAAPLFELRKFSNVQHLVSTVRGTLRSGVLPLDALLACFPGGSITGAPKKRAMEIIEELEPAPRGFYCGSQFVQDDQGNLESSILIRTFQTQGDHIVCHGGGGIVIDSVASQEYDESLFKVAQLMAALPKQR
ncbi:MAG: aminodeoxychorismate synthase component I [Gammaproteobacteria bacterium HGW-Gammaproteobacteria-14]|nr:MAG: aminodeoxychorismate synthase component I [Gammaproteobacteria bacterium HGW-Gammaproteobacteria-14]